MLTKARHVHDAVASGQLPSYLLTRLERSEVLPTINLLNIPVEGLEGKVKVVLEYVIKQMRNELFVELMMFLGRGQA